MKKRFLKIVGAWLFGGSVCWAGADPTQLRLLGNPTFLQPREIAGIRYESGAFFLTTPWLEYDGGGVRSDCFVCFDNFELGGGFPGWPADGAASGGYDPDCGLGSSRWAFGTAYCNMFSVNDLTVAPGQEGAQADRAAFAWYAPIHDGFPQACLVIVLTAEDFDDTCAGPPSAQAYAGVLYKFVLQDLVGGYYFSDVSLRGTGLFHQMPFDGRGASLFLIASNYDPRTGTIFPFSCAQPMLWGTKNLNGTNPSRQGPVEWDDDNPIDGAHTAPRECYSYAYGACPDPLGATLAFYACDGPRTAPGDANCDGAVDFFDLEPFINAVVDGITPCAFNAVDVNQDGVLDFFDIDPFVTCVLNGGC